MPRLSGLPFIGTVCPWTANTARVTDPPCQEGLERLHEKQESTSTPRCHPTGALIARHRAQQTLSPRGDATGEAGGAEQREASEARAGPRAAGRIPPSALPPPQLSTHHVPAVLSDPGSRFLGRV